MSVVGACLCRRLSRRLCRCSAMRIVRGTKSAIGKDALAFPLEVGGPGCEWDAASLGELREAIVSAAGHAWEAFGPTPVRPGYCLVYFAHRFEEPPQSPFVVLGRLQDWSGPADAVAGAPPKARYGPSWRPAGAVTLRMFPGQGLGYSDSEVIDAWLSPVLGRIGQVRGEPRAVYFSFVEVRVESLAAAERVLSDIGCHIVSPMSAIWPEPEGCQILAGRVESRVLQVAVAGLDALDDVARVCAGLVDLARSLASIVEPLYARVAIDPVGLETEQPDSRMQPGGEYLVGPDWTERNNLLGAVPDAYWWQLIDRSLFERSGAHVPNARPFGERLVEITFGDPEQWRPAKGIGDAFVRQEPSRTLLEARQALRPMLLETSQRT